MISAANAEFFQNRLQMAGDGGEMGFIQAFFDQRRVGRPHVFAGIVIWAAKRVGEKRLLLRALSRHVRGVKKMTDGSVHQNILIKDFNRGIDRGAAANTFE